MPKCTKDMRCFLSTKAKYYKQFVSIFLAFAVLSGCGYGFTGNDPSILGGPGHTLIFKGVENPTMHTWLGYMIRTDLRDEITARNIATWVDDGKADFSIYVKVHSFTMRSSVRSKDDSTLIFTGDLRMEATVYKEDDNSVVWTSGLMSYSEQFVSNSAEEAGDLLVKQLSRWIVSKMRTAF